MNRKYLHGCEEYFSINSISVLDVIKKKIPETQWKKSFHRLWWWSCRHHTCSPAKQTFVMRIYLVTLSTLYETMLSHMSSYSHYVNATCKRNTFFEKTVQAVVCLGCHAPLRKVVSDSLKHENNSPQHGLPWSISNGDWFWCLKKPKWERRRILLQDH